MEGLHLRRYSSQCLVLEQANTVDELTQSILTLQSEAKAEALHKLKAVGYKSYPFALG